MGLTFGFVVLNYNNYMETIACVESILNISSRNFYIAIVDNASKNDSINILSKIFEKHKNIKVMSSGRNGGYSYGNNCGIRYLESIGIHDFIIATSDTLILSQDILQQLERIDAKELGIVGPKVITGDNCDQNPLEHRVNLNYILNIHFPAIASFCRNLIFRISPSVKERVGVRKDNLRKKLPCSDVYMVHGCFLYLTKAYFEKCGYLDESLFMYGEEDLLAYNCSKNGLKVLYQPNIVILHKEARSTPKENNNNFTSMNMKQSRNYLKRKLKMSSLLMQALRKR